MSKLMVWRQMACSLCIRKVNSVVDLPIVEFGASVPWAAMCLVCENRDRPNRKVNRYVCFCPKYPRFVSLVQRTVCSRLRFRFMKKRIYCKMAHSLIYAVLHCYGDRQKVYRAHRWVEMLNWMNWRHFVRNQLKCRNVQCSICRQNAIWRNL